MILWQFRPGKIDDKISGICRMYIGRMSISIANAPNADARQMRRLLTRTVNAMLIPVATEKFDM